MRPASAPFSYRVIIRFFRILCRAFFRRITVTGLDNVPADAGGILVAWHPNGLIDPGLVLTQCPRQVVFGARHGIFAWPLLGALMRSIGTVPIFRAVDLPHMSQAERIEANQQSLAALARRIAEGALSALFPEGVSHDAPHLQELKSGAARLYYQARAMQGAGEPAVIIPVGLHYDDKDLFRSDAHVIFYPPLELDGELAFDPTLDADGAREQVRRLTAEIERVLADVVLATATWELHRLMHRARKLIRAERAQRAGADPGKSRMDERLLGFARVRAGYRALLAREPDKVAELVARVDDYDEDLRALGLEDHELDRPPRVRGKALAWVLLLQVLTVYLLLPPALLVGWLVNAPAALLLIALSKAVSKRRKDEATVKVLVGAVLFPLSWLGAGLLATWTHGQLHAAFPSIPDRPILAALVVVALAAVGGAAAVRYLRIARETWRAVRVRLTRAMRRRHIERLRSERSELHDALIAVSTGMELPGAVAPDGRVVAGIE